MRTRERERDPDIEQENDALEVWEAHGLRCMIRQNRPGALNGYVQLPKDHPDFKRGTQFYDWGDWIFEAWSKEITYGPDEGGWVGFDTYNAFDWWLRSELPKGRRVDHRVITRHPRAEPWTRERLRQTTEELAALMVKRVTKR